jgi:hypothetical protein
LMYNKNNRGPRTEPWGTPCWIFDQYAWATAVHYSLYKGVRNKTTYIN